MQICLTLILVRVSVSPRNCRYGFHNTVIKNFKVKLMKITKQALIQVIKRSRFITSFRFTSDEVKRDKDEQIKQFKKELDRLIRSQKDFTINIIED